MQQPIHDNNPISFAKASENQYFDRKSARLDPKDVARHLSAFANASGGKLVIGIEDNGEITGFKCNGARNVEEYKQVALTKCAPVPEVQAKQIYTKNSYGNDDFILVLEVTPSSGHVITRCSDGAVFLRQKDSSVKLNHEQILALEYDKNQRHYEDEVEERSSIADVNAEVMARFKDELGTEASDEQVLRSRGFLLNGHLTNAGILLFANNPTRFMPCARVRVIRIDGTKMETGPRLNIVKERTFDGPLPKIIEGAKDFIASQLREFQYLGGDGRFKIIPEYPEFAWFEGLVNAVTHRDYAMSGDHIRVLMYDDRLEITSPGKLPNIVTLENMKYTRWSRNPTIARTLVEFGWVRELNEGVQRIYDEMADYFLKDPTFSEPNEISVQLTLENSITSRVLRQTDSIVDAIGEDIYHSLNEYEIITMQYVYARERIKVSELKNILGRSDKFAKTTLQQLEEKGLLVWHGSNSRDPFQFYARS